MGRKRSALTIGDQLYIEAVLGKVSLEEIAGRLDCGLKAVSKYAASLGMSQPQQESVSPAKREIDPTREKIKVKPLSEEEMKKAAVNPPIPDYAKPFTSPETQVTVMTAAAGEHADEQDKAWSPRQYAEHNADRIFKMDPNKVADPQGAF